MKKLLLQKNFALFLSILMMGFVSDAFAQPTVLGTQLVNGSYSTSNLNTIGGFKQVRLQATSAAASGARTWEFAKGTAASTDYSSTWRPYTGGNILSINNFIPTSFDNGAKFNNPGGSSGQLPAIVSGRYYTFNVSNLNADNVMSLLETTYNPVTISSTTRFNNTVNIVTSGTPNAAENIFVRYTTNAFSTSTIVQATGSGTSWSATIPATGSVTYYIYSSNRSKAAIDGDVTTYGQGVHDMSTLSLLNNAQANYTYTATSIISYNEITDANPSLSNPFIAGQVVNANATASGIGRSAALNASGAANRYSASNWPTGAIDLNKYFEFTLTPNSGYRLNFTDFTYVGQVSSGTPTVVLRSSVDGYSTNIGTASASGTTISLSAAAYQSITSAITFRYYAYGLPATTTTLSINDYTFNGTVDPLPANPLLAITGTTAHGTICPSVAASPITYTITNSGPVAATGVTVVSNDAQFVVSGLSSTTITASGGTATYQVTFTPASAGAKTATITVASATSGSNSPTSSLTGTGATAVTAAVTTTAATAVVATTATLNGNVTALGVCPASTFKGFVYALTAANATPTIGGTGVTATTPVAASAGAFNTPITGLATGSAYSFRAYVYDGTTYTYGSVLTFTTVTPPVNDDCANAIALTLGAAAITGNTANATQSIPGCTGNANDDVWYSFTTTAAGTYTITVTASASFDAVVGVRSGACPGTNLFCVDGFNAGGTETVTATGLSASTTYLVRVYDFTAGVPATTTFTIAVTAPPATLSTNGTTTLAFGSSNVLTSTASQTFNLSGSALTGAPGNITVTAPNTDFQVSNNNSTWGATTTIAYSASTLASTPVYVRFVPQSSGAKTGNITFSGGGVATPPTIAVTGTGILPAPTANAATNVLATSFDANWTAVTGAIGYLLDVSTSPTFSVPGGSASVTESFETGLTGSYQTGDVTLGTGVWGVTNVLKGTSGVNSGVASAQLQSATGSALVSPTFTDVTTVSFWVRASTAAGAVQVNYSTDGGTTWIPTSNSPYTGLGTTSVQENVTINIAGDIKLQFLRTATTISIDDIIINTLTSTPSFVTGYNSLAVGNVTTYNVSGLTAGTTYYYRVRATDGTPSANSNTVTVTPASVGGTAVANQTICSGATPADLTLSGNTGNVIRWEKASDAAFTTPITIANTTTTLSGATIGALTATTYFRAVVQSGTNPIAYSSTVTITVNPVSVGGTVASNATVCSGTNSGTLNLTGQTGTVVRWESSLDNFATAGTTIANTTTSLTYTNITATTSYRAVVQSGTCAAANSASATITVNPVSVGGTVATSTTVCSGTNSGTLNLTGQTGTILRWESSLDNFATAGTTIANTTTSLTYTNITATTSYRAVVQSGTCAAANSASATITVNPVSVGGTVASSATVCSGTNSGTLNLTGQTGTILRWESSLDNFATAGTAIANTTTSLTYTNLTATTSYRAVVQSGSCASANSSSATITVDAAAVGGTIAGGTTVCSGNNGGTLTLTGQSGTITGWESSVDNFATAGTPIANTTTTQSYTNLTVTTYYRAAVSNGTCGSTFSTVATVTVDTNSAWTGAVSTDWNDAGNWSCGAVPTLGVDATITAVTNQPIVSADAFANSVTMNAGTTLTVASAANLTVANMLDVDSAATLTVQNNANLIQVNDTNNNTGAIVVNRDSNPLMRLDYTLWSAPVSGQNLLSFSPGTLPTRFYVYNPGTDLYNTVDPSTTGFDAGTGYLIRVPNTHPTTPTIWSGTFAGAPNNGNVSVGVGSGTYNAVGNPYPSTIDADQFITQNSLTEALYFWRKTNNTLTTSYATYTLAGGAGTSSNSGDPLSLIPNGIIQVGQGFIAKATSSSLFFNNGMRVADNNNQFFRSSSVERNRIWLNLTNTDGIFSQTMVAYMTGATQGVDAAIDGLYFNDSQLALTSLIGTTEYAVQGRALPFDASDIVPMGFKAINAGTYTIGLDHFDGLFNDASQDIFLKDNLTNTTHDLRAGSYTFATEAGVFNDRFQIVYQTTLGTNQVQFTANQVVVYKQGQDIAINTGKVMMAKVRVYDIRGRLIVEKSNINATETKIFAGTTNEVLIVKITSADGSEVSKKVVN